MFTAQHFTAIQNEIERIAPSEWTVTVEYPGYIAVTFKDENGLTAHYAAGFEGGSLMVNELREDGEYGGGLDTRVPETTSPLWLAIHIAATIDGLERACSLERA